jgi:hypothetical protein
MTGNAIRLLRALVDEAMAEKQTVISRGRCAFKVHGSRSLVACTLPRARLAGSRIRLPLADCGRRIWEGLDGSS